MDCKKGCENCLNRETCDELCPAAKAFADQDYVSQKEMTLDHKIIDAINWPERWRLSVRKQSKEYCFTDGERKVLQALFVINKANWSKVNKKIFGYLGMNQGTFRTHMTNLRKKIFEEHYE